MKKTLIIFGALCFIAPVAYAKLSATGFPQTFSDMSFRARMDNINDGYKPFLDKKAYQELNIVEGEEMYTDHMLAVMENDANQQNTDATTMNIEEYCAKYPEDTIRCPHQEITPPLPNNNFVEPTNDSFPHVGGYTIGDDPVMENNYVIGQSCYPADHDKWYKNKVFTTGRFELSDPAFEKAMITIFRKEGTTCGTIPNDPGGYSCYGISSTFQKIPANILKNYTIADAEDLYYERFWKKYKMYKLPDVISSDVFLACVGSGVGTGFQHFRTFLGLPSKSSPVDDEMINAVKNYNGDIHNRWMDYRDNFLQKVANTRYKNQPNVGKSYKHAIEIKRKNGCHVRPQNPLYRD